MDFLEEYQELPVKINWDVFRDTTPNSHHKWLPKRTSQYRPPSTKVPSRYLLNYLWVHFLRDTSTEGKIVSEITKADTSTKRLNKLTCDITQDKLGIVKRFKKFKSKQFRKQPLKYLKNMSKNAIVKLTEISSCVVSSKKQSSRQIADKNKVKRNEKRRNKERSVCSRRNIGIYNKISNEKQYQKIAAHSIPLTRSVPKGQLRHHKPTNPFVEDSNYLECYLNQSPYWKRVQFHSEIKALCFRLGTYNFNRVRIAIVVSNLDLSLQKAVQICEKMLHQVDKYLDAIKSVAFDEAQFEKGKLSVKIPKLHGSKYCTESKKYENASDFFEDSGSVSISFAFWTNSSYQSAKTSLESESSTDEKRSENCENEMKSSMNILKKNSILQKSFEVFEENVLRDSWNEDVKIVEMKNNCLEERSNDTRLRRKDEEKENYSNRPIRKPTPFNRNKNQVLKNVQLN